MKRLIPFNNAHFSKEIPKKINRLFKSKFVQTAAGFNYSKKCNQFIEKKLNVKKYYITNSWTAALEVAAIVINLKKGDEVILPSYTFVSTANAILLRGATPVYVDIKDDDLNINEELISQSITKRTKAIIVVHYAGFSCNMLKIKKIAKKNNLFLIEDAAQSFLSKHKNKYLGTIGDIGCISFHETKNITSAEGGAILINNKKLIKKCSIVVHKGTDRENYERLGKKFYSWQGIGSSYMPSDIICLILYHQLKNSMKITLRRKKIWMTYYKKLSFLGKISKFQNIKLFNQSNGHMFYLLFKNKTLRDFFLKELNENGIQSTFHYIPLHITPFGKKHGKNKFNLKVTESIYNRIIRLPLWYDVNYNVVIKTIKKIYKKLNNQKN